MTLSKRLVTFVLSALGAACLVVPLSFAGPAFAGAVSAGAESADSGHPGGPPISGTPSYNGLALTPPMGFNTWYQYRCNINETNVLANGRALVSSGLARLGYDSVNLDDCWMAPTRASDGQLQADPTRFPHGMKWLADQLHAMGLKLGVYESIGTVTCQKLPGSLGHYQQDADTFAAWGVDLLKFDYCGVTSGHDPSADYEQMSQALLESGRDIVFSGEAPIDAHNADPSDPRFLPLVSLSSKISNMWRMAPDLTTDFNSTIFGHLANDLPLAQYAHPGAWNDLDMLLTGNSSTSYNFNWSVAQQETQMSIWSVLASPLIVSTDLTAMSADTERILSNQDVIAVDQDPLGQQGRQIAKDGSTYVVAKPLVHGDVALMFVNTSSVAQTVQTTAHAIGSRPSAAYSVKDLWTHTNRESGGTIAASVPADSAALYRVSPLRDGVGKLPPVSTVTVSPDVPPAYPGSSYAFAQAGSTITVPAEFANDGAAAATKVSLSVSGPPGWRVSGAPATAGAVPGDHRLSGTWRVTVPPGTAAGSYAVTATVKYDWNGRHTETAQSTGSFRVADAPTGTPYLSDLTWLSATSTFHNSIIKDKNYFGGPLSIHGVVYPKGLWANSIAAIDYYLGGTCTRLTADLGLDDSVQGNGAVDYQLYADGQKVYDSGVVTNSTQTVHADVDVSGAQILQLAVAEGNGTNQFGNADFGSPQLTCDS